MIPLPPTSLMTLYLIVATLLGAGIGACLWQLRSAARFRRALEGERRKLEAEREALDAVLVREREGLALKHARASEVMARAREQCGRAQARHDALAVHAREQGRRIDALEAEILAYEERHVKLQRDIASDRAGRRVASGAATRPGVRREEDDVPVLNRRVGGPAPEANFPIGGDLDIPTLAESELPEQADDLALELLDTRGLFADRDD